MPSRPQDALASILIEDVPSEEIPSIVLKVAQRLKNKKYDDSGLQHAKLVASLLVLCQALLSPPQLLEAEILLHNFVLTYLSEHEPGDLRVATQVVQVCEYSDTLLGRLVSLCARKISFTVQALVHEPGGFAIRPIAQTQTYQKTTRADDNIIEQLDASHAIVCLKVLSYSNTSIFSSIQGIEMNLLYLVGATSQELSANSRDTLNALIVRSTRSTFTDHSLWTFWDQILALTSRAADRHHATAGYQLWACMISRQHDSLRHLYTDHKQYWKWIQQGLLSGTTEQRKTCLFILQASLQFLAAHTSPALCFVPHTFTKYSNVYQNCVLQKYLNQIQDALPDLLTLSQRDSGVGASWILALLGAALEHDTQDAVRNIIGGWILSHGLPVVLGAIEDVPEFLEKSFLAWACVGSLYASSLTRSFSESPICHHGERLSQFLIDILNHDTNFETKHNTVKAIMSFIVNGGGSLHATARVFLLQALVNSLVPTNFELDQEEVELVLAITYQANFQQMGRDLMTLQCGELLTLIHEGGQESSKIAAVAKESAAIKAGTTRLNVNDEHEKAYDYLESFAQDAKRPMGDDHAALDHSKSRNLSLVTLNQWIRASKARCLWHEGLYHGCVYINQVLDMCEHDFECEELEFAFEAIWDQLEVQDYPKTILMMLPSILFHKSSVRLLKKDSALIGVLSKALHELHALAENRIYVFPPLAEALYVAFAIVPQAVYLPFVATFSRFANNPPTTRIEFQLENAIAPKLERLAPGRTYFFYYGASEAVGHAYLLRTLNDLPITPAWTNLRQELLDTLLHAWIHQKQPVPMSSKFKSSAQLQTMLLLLEGLRAHLSHDEITVYTSSFQHILALEPHPRYRLLLEWILLRLYSQLPISPRFDLLKILSEADHHGNPKYLASLLKLSTMLARLPDSSEAFSLELMTHLIPLVASAKIVIRHEAQWTFPILWSHVERQGWYEILTNPAFLRLNGHIRSLDAYKNPPPARVLEMFDPTQDHNLVTLYCGRWLGIAPPEPAKVSPKEIQDVIVKYHAGNEKVGVLPLGLVTSPTGETKSLSLNAAAASTNTTNTLVPLQTKASTFALPTSLISDSITSPHPARKARNIILIASLIANPFNLGGLSRISEIFGVSALYIPSLSVLGHKDFTSVSVSSHFWLPIHELSGGGNEKSGGDSTALRDFLTKKKVEGWKVVGIEQTDSSFVIGRRQKQDEKAEGDNSTNTDIQSGRSQGKSVQGEYQFPERVVLLLGSEREGIPPILLAETDQCVEIEQVSDRFKTSTRIRTTNTMFRSDKLEA